MKDNRLEIRIDTETKTKLFEYAKKKGTTVASILTNYIKKLK